MFSEISKQDQPGKAVLLKDKVYLCEKVQYMYKLLRTSSRFFKSIIVYWLIVLCLALLKGYYVRVSKDATAAVLGYTILTTILKV